MNKLLVFSLAAISIAIFTMNSHAQRVQWYASDNATNNYHLLSEQPFGNIEGLRFGDFDGNGITDVFTVDPAGQWMLSYNGTSPFQVINVDSTRSINDLRFGDFDGDGKADVFAVTASGQWMISSGGGTPYQTLASDPNFTLNDLRFGDFNNNDRTDVFVVDTQGVYGEPGRWRYSDGAVSSWETLAGDASRTIDQYLFADIVGDRRTDVFTIASDGTWLASDGGAGGYQQLAGDASRTINDLRIGDFDFDLYADVFTTDAAGQWYISYRGTNGYLAVAQDGDRTIDDLRFGDAVNDTRYGDFNGDGATDVFMVKELPLNKPLRNGSAIKFNGTDQHVFVSEIDAPFQYEFSAEAWIKFSPTISTPSYTILSKGDSGTGTIFSVWSDDKLAFYPGGNGSDGVAWVFSDVAIPRDEWVHVAVAHGGTVVAFYINGQPAGSPSVSPNRAIHQSKSISIGNQNGVLPYSTYVNLFQGEIADVRLWNSVLTQEKILKSIDQPLPPNQPGLAGYWPMNDASGFTVLSAYAGANGLLVNENSSWTSARIPLYQGQALSFDGVDDFVKLPNYPPSFNEMTIEAWVYLHDTNPGTFKTIFTKGTANNGTIFSISNENKLAFYPGSSSWAYSTNSVPENQWTHVAVVRKGDQTTFYINGAEDSTHTHAGVLDPTSNASIGNQDGDGSDNLTTLFTGRMDELRVWYDARTSNEIAGNMLNTVLYNEQGLVTYYKMDNLYGTTVIDQTLNNVNGIAQNNLGRVSSDIFNSANLPDPTTGKISNGVVSIGDLLSGAANATYSNINITDIPDIGSVYIPGEVEVNVNANGGDINGGGGSVNIFELPFTVHGLALRNGKLGLDVSLTPPNEFFTWDDNNRSYLLMDSSGVELDGGRIDVQNAWFLKFTVKDGYVELRTSEKEFGAGAKVSIPGAGLKGLISPKVWDGYFKTVDGLPSAFSIKGTNLGVPLGVPQVVLHTVGLEGSNLTDLSQMIFTGQMKITAGLNVGTLSSPVFPVALDTVGTVKSNGYIDINSDLTMFKIFHAGGANITYRPPTDFAVNNAYINFLDVYKSTTDLSVIDGAFSGSMKGELQIPTSVPIFGGLNLASAQAVIHDYKHFSGSISVTGIPIGVENVEHCVDLKGTECVLGVCVTIDLGRHCITVPEPVLSSTLKLNFDYNNGVFTYPANAPDPTLAWEVPYNKTYHTQSGTFSFMTNWNRVDKALKAPASVKQIASLASAPSPGEVSGEYRPFQTEPGGDPVTVFTLDEGDFDAIFRITYENADVTDISATLTKPDGETIDIHDGAFPDSFQDGIGFTRIIPETREAYFYLFEHDAGEYTVTLNNTDHLGAYSAELLVETPAPFVDLVSVFPWEDNDFDLLW
ncbi:FG-GAP-like repeat-containing protein, partial [bacterium]|nr:FG-GAP-like repeat-containing protein [bacterium]